MESQGYDSQAAPGGYASTTHPDLHATNPNTTTPAAQEKKGVAGKVKGLLGGHGQKTTDANLQQGGVYGDATPTTGNAQSTRVGCLDKIKAKAGVGHGAAPEQKRAQGTSDPSASPDFNGGTNVHSSAAVHGGWPHPTNPRHTESAYGQNPNQATAAGGVGVPNPNQTTPASDYGVANPQQDPAAGGYVQNPNQTPAVSGYGVQNPNQAPTATGHGVGNHNQVPTAGSYGVQNPNQATAGNDYGAGNPNQATSATGYGVSNPNQAPAAGGYGVQNPNQATTGGDYGVGNPNRAPPAGGYGVQNPNQAATGGDYGVGNPNQAPPAGGYGVQTPDPAPATGGSGYPQPMNPTGATNPQGGAVLGDHHGNVHEGPRDDTVKKEGFMSKIMDKLHSPKGKPAHDSTTPNPN